MDGTQGGGRAANGERNGWLIQSQVHEDAQLTPVI